MKEITNFGGEGMNKHSKKAYIDNLIHHLDKIDSEIEQYNSGIGAAEESLEIYLKAKKDIILSELIEICYGENVTILS